MSLLSDLGAELVAVVSAVVGALPFVIGYILLVLAAMFVWSFIKRLMTPKHDYGSLKTVTFGDESAVTSNTAASVVSIVLIFLFWGAFTGSKLLPGFLHMPGPYVGESSFTYTASDGTQTDDATVNRFRHGVDVAQGHAEYFACQGYSDGADLAARTGGSLGACRGYLEGWLSQFDVVGTSGIFVIPRGRRLFAGCDCGYPVGVCDGSVELVPWLV